MYTISFYSKKSNMRNEIKYRELYSMFSNTPTTKHAGPKILDTKDKPYHLMKAHLY